MPVWALCRWKYDTKVHLKEMAGGCGHESSCRGWGPVVEYCEHTDEKPLGFLNAKKFFTSYVTVSFSRDLVCVTKWEVDRLIGSFF